MSILFYKLNDFNEPSLKHVFIASLPTALQPDLQRQLTATNLNIADISLGKNFQTAMLCLDKICEHKEFFKDLMADKKPFSEACKKPYLQIECKDEKKCFCPIKKKKHFQKHFHKKSSSKKPFRYFKKKDVSQYRKKKHNRCFICKKRGHFAKNCPHKYAKAVRLIQHLQHSSLLYENEDVESHFSEQSSQDDQTAFILAESSDSDDISKISIVQNVNQMFLPYTDILRLYTISNVPTPYSHISQKLLEFCPDNHSQFHHPSPLWKNEQFFIHLPFKLNENINPTKASHPSMSPSDLLLAKQECSQLLQQGLIEPTDSDWACQAFYVEKRSELVRVAPSLFQKAMTKIFNPILRHALVYIDDILLFSPDHDSHQQLLLDFFHIVQFPNTNLTKIQQFLGIVNYVRDFIPRVAIHTSQLSRMLKKQYPPWGPTQIEAVKQLKVIAQSPPPLRIPPTGQRILQTDASDDYWSAILLESIDGMDHFCAYASGQFKAFEKNYHVIYKEILAVKYRIKKFEFHLISHNSSFPRIFDFKNKLLPDKQLLNLKTWFSKYDFTVQHIKGKQNLIPDFLTRPAINKPSLLSSTHIIPIIAMNRQLPFKALNQRSFPMNILFSSAYQIQDFAKKFLYRYFFNVHITSVLRAYLMELNNVQLPATDIHHTSVGPSHSLEIVPKTQTCTPGSSSSPHGILVMEQRPDYTNVLFQDAQDPWEDFQSLLHTLYTVTNPDSPASSTTKMTNANEEKYLQTEASLDQRQIWRAKRQYEKETGDISPSPYPSTP
ncbi:hypothetical protein KPL71_021589 [Citrus sinensis]|uniref:Uncharacterized protein n=1 Tax=Citrus sinensis TaxID=2711 RepID=A0ACB8JGT1_CITSI|nr:hypothetical protein KPL71_021589 [Citrus sinensis]